MAIIEGTANNDTLNGGTEADTLYGRAGNDWLDGGLGIDRMEGGLGDDAYVVRDQGDSVFEALNEGWDYVVAYLTYYALTDHVENLHAGPGTVGFHGVGNALFNQIFGTSGADVLDGGGGADILFGGAGDDTYHVDHADDSVSEKADGGTDTVIVSGIGAHTLHAHVERLFYNGASAFSAKGNAIGNELTTGTGNDTLEGGGGADILSGGAGNDIYVVEDDTDQVVEYFGGGTDTIRTAFSNAEFRMANHVENLVYIGSGNFQGYGNGLDNRIEGSMGDDVLYGGAGQDTLIGFGGRDTYWVDHANDSVIEAANGGEDLIYSAAAYYVLPDNVESLMFGAGGTDFHFVGNALNNWIVGFHGNDILNGGAGNDRLVGGGGNDIYVFDSSLDVAEETPGNGYDTVNIVNGVSHTLGANIEKLVAHTPWDFFAYGNALDNALVTAEGNDWLDGGLGADTMTGKSGDDTYYIDHAGDTVVEASGEGTDTLRIKIGTYVMPLNVENLILETLSIALTATGNALDNAIDGGYENDRLDGGAGADTLRGHYGDDVYVLDHFGDRAVEAHGAGTDEIRTALGSRTDFSQMFVLPENIEHLTGTSATGQGVYGNAHDNIVSMGAGSDLVVMHDGGRDTVNGGGGDDFVYYGGALDAYDLNDGGAGFDTLGLLGTYSHVFTGGNFANFEKLAVYSSGGGAAMPNHYDLIMSDANVAAGKTLMVIAQSLLADETLMFDGSAETNGTFNIRGGRGNDRIQGGEGSDQISGNLGADILAGSGGNDIFEYRAAEESTVFARDTILDFTAGDKINLKNIDADGNAANGNSKFVFLGEGWFTGKGGEVRTVQTGEGWLVEADIDGDTFADLSIAFIDSAGHIPAASDFWL